MARQRFKETDPVEEILKIALDNEGGVDNSLRQRLLASASELGISEEAALAAERQWLLQREQQMELEAYRTHVKVEFLGHLGIYLVVNLFLIGINLLKGGHAWSAYPLLGWGIGVCCHLVAAIVEMKHPSDKDMNKWRAERLKGGKQPTTDPQSLEA